MQLLNVSRVVLHLRYDEICTLVHIYLASQLAKSPTPRLLCVPWPEKDYSCIRVSVATSLQLIWKASSRLSNRVTDVVAPLLSWSGG